MRNFDTCDRGFTLRLLRDYEAETRACHALQSAVARKHGKPVRPFAETKAAYLRLWTMAFAPRPDAKCRLILD